MVRERFKRYRWRGDALTLLFLDISGGGEGGEGEDETGAD